MQLGGERGAPHGHAREAVLVRQERLQVPRDLLRVEDERILPLRRQPRVVPKQRPVPMPFQRFRVSALSGVSAVGGGRDGSPQTERGVGGELEGGHWPPCLSVSPAVDGGAALCEHVVEAVRTDAVLDAGGVADDQAGAVVRVRLHERPRSLRHVRQRARRYLVERRMASQDTRSESFKGD
eukprot:1183266-Prorocentrum_minimum.AAC.2